MTSVAYQPDPNWSGTDALEVSVSDNGNGGANGIADALSASAILPIAVNAVNDAVAISMTSSDFVTSEDTPLLLSGISLRDPDAVAGQTFRLSVSAKYGEVETASSAQGSTLSMDVTVQDATSQLATLKYVPKTDWNSVAASERDVVTICVADDVSATPICAQADVEVRAVNDKPSATVPAASALSVVKGSTLSITGIVVTDVDVDDFNVNGGSPGGDNVNVVEALLSSAQQGLLWVYADATKARSTLSIRGSIGQINAALRTLKYSPKAVTPGEDKVVSVTSGSTLLLRCLLPSHRPLFTSPRLLSRLTVPETVLNQYFADDHG